MTVFAPGVDYLAGVHYETDMIATHPPGWVACIFLVTFGDAHKTIENMCRSNKFSEIVIHLAAFDSTHTYPINKYDFKADLQWCEHIRTTYPNTQILISPFCEHNHSAADMKPVFDQVRILAPTCIPLNSIWKGQTIDGITTELHLGNSKTLPHRPTGPYTISFDGFGGDGSGNFTDTNISDIAAHYPDARHFRLWDFRYNGKFGHNDVSDVSHRSHWPDANYLRGHNAMLKAREGVISYPSNAVYKPFAEDSGSTDTRNNKALVICQANKQSVDVHDKNGKKIATMSRFTPDSVEPHGARYYSQFYAYQLGDTAAKSSGGSRLIGIDNLPLTDADLRSSLFK